MTPAQQNRKLKESIIIRHPESINNLSCVDSVLLSSDGVLTSGDYKIMAVSSLTRNYFLDVTYEDKSNSEVN